MLPQEVDISELKYHQKHFDTTFDIDRAYRCYNRFVELFNSGDTRGTIQQKLGLSNSQWGLLIKLKRKRKE